MVLNRRQYEHLRGIVAASRDGQVSEAVLAARCGGLAAAHELAAMDLITEHDSGFAIETAAVNALVDYRNARREIWGQRMWNFWTGAFVGIIAGAFGLLLAQWVALRVGL